MGEHSAAASKRAFGPFTSRQLTLIVCVGIVSVLVILPTAAFAAIGSFSSSTAAPAVSAVNTSPAPNAVGVLGRAVGAGNAPRLGVVASGSGTSGVGVLGSGAKFGVLSNGPLGVGGTNQLKCTKCVTAGDIANRIVVNYNLAPGANSAPVVIPANVPVNVVGVQTNISYRGVASVSMLRVPNDFLEWTGIESPSAAPATITSGYSGLLGTHIVSLDFSHRVDIQVNDGNSFRIHNGNVVAMAGSVLITW